MSCGLQASIQLWLQLTSASSVDLSTLSPPPPLSYGATAASFFANSMFLLLTGVVLTSVKHYTPDFEAAAKGAWTSSCEGGGGGGGAVHMQRLRVDDAFLLQPMALLHYAATNALVGAYVLAFISCGLELAVAVAMIANRKSFDEREGARGVGTVKAPGLLPCPSPPPSARMPVDLPPPSTADRAALQE